MSPYVPAYVPSLPSQPALDAVPKPQGLTLKDYLPFMKPQTWGAKARKDNGVYFAYLSCR